MELNGAPSLKTGQMGRNENDGVVRRVGSSEAFRRRRRLSVAGEFEK
jgi:hypothetical protein